MLLLLSFACVQEVEETAEVIEEGALFQPIASDGLSVESVEPARYLGLWYEIATTPGMQQSNCAGTTAEYGLADENTISVLNRCYLGSLDGNLNEIEGIATIQDDSYARLLVDFDLGFVAPYNIVALDGSDSDEPYEFAAVSSYSALWILSRSPDIDEEVYELLLEDLTDRDYAVEDLVTTDQP